MTLGKATRAQSNVPFFGIKDACLFPIFKRQICNRVAQKQYEEHNVSGSWKALACYYISKTRYDSHKLEFQQKQALSFQSDKCISISKPL